MVDELNDLRTLGELKELNVGDKVATRKWKKLFTVVHKYKNYIYLNTEQSNQSLEVHLFIDTNKDIVYFGGQRFSKENLSGIANIEKFIDRIIKREYKLESRYGIPTKLMLSNSNFDKKDLREQVEINYKDE